MVNLKGLVCRAPSSGGIRPITRTFSEYFVYFLEKYQLIVCDDKRTIFHVQILSCRPSDKVQTQAFLLASKCNPALHKESSQTDPTNGKLWSSFCTPPNIQFSQTHQNRRHLIRALSYFPPSQGRTSSMSYWPPKITWARRSLNSTVIFLNLFTLT